MHAFIPKATAMTTTGHLPLHGRSLAYSAKAYLCPWLSTDVVEEVEVDNYFREHRRKNFSDVCHAKLVSVTNPFTPIHFGRWKYLKTPWSSSADYFGTGNGVAEGRDQDSSGRLTSWSGIVVGDGKNCFIGHCTINGDSTTLYVSVMTRFYHRTSVKNKTINYKYIASSSNYRRYGGQGQYEKSYGSGKVQERDFLSNFCYGLWEKNKHQYRYFNAQCLEVIEHFMWATYNYYVQSLPDLSGWTSSSMTIYNTEPVDTSVGPEFFKLHEPDAIMSGIDDVLLGKGFEAYWRHVLEQHAYLEAVRSVPRLNDNSISNLLEITKFITDLVVHHKISIPTSLSSAWLAYRYQYTTGKLDAEEAIQFVHRRMDLQGREEYKCYGQHTINYDGIPITCRCTLRAKPKTLSTVGKVWRALYTYGLSPSFYLVWDMIPYSFIVDWFLPISDVMTAWDAEREYNGKYDIEDINFSLSYDVPDPTRGVVHCYTRWWSSTPLALQGFYFLEDNNPSEKTIKCRILDAASLIIR